MKNKKKGFSLVELLIVLGISSILMAMSAPKYQGIVGKANELEQGFSRVSGKNTEISEGVYGRH